jgi:hypothetical protein
MEFLPNIALFSGIVGSITIIFKLFFSGRKLLKSGISLINHFLLCYVFYKKALLKYISENNQQDDLKVLLQKADIFLEQSAKIGVLLSVDQKIILKLKDMIKETDYKK